MGSKTMRFELDREIAVTLLQLFNIIVDLVRNRSTTNIVETTKTFKTHASSDFQTENMTYMLIFQFVLYQ